MGFPTFSDTDFPLSLDTLKSLFVSSELRRELTSNFPLLKLLSKSEWIPELLLSDFLEVSDSTI